MCVCVCVCVSQFANVKEIPSKTNTFDMCYKQYIQT